MSKVIQITPPNPRFRKVLDETIAAIEEMRDRAFEDGRRLLEAGPVEAISHEVDEELVAFESKLRPVDQEALVALAGLRDRLEDAVTTLRRVAEGKGQAPTEPGPFLVDTDLLEVIGSKDGIRGWLEYSDLTGKGARPVEFLSICTLTLESIENGRRVIAIGIGVDEEGHEGEVRVVTEENLRRDIEQYLAPMRGTWEWLEVEESE